MAARNAEPACYLWAFARRKWDLFQISLDLRFLFTVLITAETAPNHRSNKWEYRVDLSNF